MTYLCENCDYSIDIDLYPYIKWFEWIPYNQFNDIKEIAKVDFTTLYSAIWLDGPLKYDHNRHNRDSDDIYDKEHKRMSNEEVILKYLDNSQDNVNEFILNEAKPYIINKDLTDGIIYGISQDPNTKDYIMVLNDYCCEKCEIRSDSIILYSAIWLNGPLKYDYNTKWERMPNEKVALEFLHNSNNITNKILQKIKQIYGISRNPDTNDYVIVFQDFYCRNCDIDIIVEWIPYDQLINIKEISNSFTHYTAMWVNGPLQYEKKKQEYERLSNVKVDLKCLGNLQTITNEFLNKVRSYFVEDNFTYLKKIQGMSKNPHTKEYLMVFRNCYCNNYRWCESCKIDNLIQNFVNQTNGNEKIDKISELLSEAKFYSIDKIIGISQHPDTKDYIIVQDYFCKKCGKHDSSIQYMAIWMNGPLQYEKNKQEYERLFNKEVSLKCLVNSQDIISELLNEVKLYSIKNDDESKIKIYGVSQHPDIKDYILVLQDCCEKCGNLHINSINKWLGKGGFSTVYSAIWIDGPLLYDKNKQEYIRSPNMKVALKCLYNSQNITNKFLNEVKAYSISKGNSIHKIYGISQNSITKDYIIVLQYAVKGSFDNYKYFFKNCNWKKRIMPYVAPEVLKCKPYTQAADIYSFENRPIVNEIEELIKSFSASIYGYTGKISFNSEFKKQFEEAEEYRKENILSIENGQSTTHPQAYYTSRLLNPFTKDLINISSVEVIDFTE
ncbi:kinase-like domain-containing protein [Rhizophagus clarus]|uniref:Kinase-like domain-containing protein n=1 Tax=Rhizophagus clarus TaxID=94130 RepID=A0A8H3R5D9_9GLOM|nr:kinase-like domain-containing protein [Rhizophagus clarus]